MPDSTEVLQELGLADAYPVSLHYAVYRCLRMAQISSDRYYNFLNWCSNFLRENSNATVQSFRDALDSTDKDSYEYTFRLYIVSDQSCLASASYIKHRLGLKAGIVLDILGLAMRIVNEFGRCNFVDNEPIISLIRNALIAYETVQVAYGLCTLDLVGSNILTNERYARLAICRSELCSSTIRDQCVITDYVRQCLENGTDIIVSEDVLAEDGLSVWKDILSPSTQQQARDFWVGIFAKHRLVFNYLLCSSLEDLEQICNKHPDVMVIMCSAGNKLPKTRTDKARLASTWPSLMLLDLLQIDADMIPGPDPLLDLGECNQPIPIQSVCIEI